MLKASALYIVIIIALVIGLLCSSLIVAAYFYRLQYQHKVRYDQLQNNLGSGINILLTAEDTSYADGKTFSLFNTGSDSVSLKRFFWGIYDVGVSRAFIQKDTLTKIFSIASEIDSSKWAALYLIDEDRPLSLSGKTAISGDAYIPKAGITTAYVDNKAYTGDKRLITGIKHTSQKQLPGLASARLNQFEQYLKQSLEGNAALLKKDSVGQSFLLPTLYINLKKQVQILNNIKLTGNIVLFSDTTIIIDSTASLSNVLVFARAISVTKGFHGNCQLFATDSIGIASDCKLDYPSCLGVLRFALAGKTAPQEKITLGENSSFSGIIFTYEKTATALKPLIAANKDVIIKGIVYASGIFKLKDDIRVYGSLFAGQFLYQNSFTLFQNYLINITIDSKALSPYFLTADLMPVAGKKKKVLQWLETD